MRDPPPGGQLTYAEFPAFCADRIGGQFSNDSNGYELAIDALYRELRRRVKVPPATLH